MTTEDFISELFYRVNETMKAAPKHLQASLWPNEIVTLGVPLAFKGIGARIFYRWVSRDWRGLFPTLHERTRLFRLLTTQRAWTEKFLATPSVLRVVDSYGIELLRSMQEGRSAQQIGRKDKSNYRWIVGGKLCLLLNHLGLVIAWDCAGANAPASPFFPSLKRVRRRGLS